MWNGMLQGSRGDGKIMEGDKSKNEIRIHPTQKPVQLYRWQMKTYAKEGWKILSPHVGSGSDRIAADEMRLDFTGYEIDEYHFTNQEKRYKEYKKQLTICYDQSTDT